MSPNNRHPDPSRPTGRDKLAEMRRQQARRQRRTRATIWTVAAVLVLAIVGGTTFAILHSRANKPSLSAVQSFGHLSREHVQGKVDYPQTPPVGGKHNPVWLNCGVYDKPVPNINAVHSLEHGAVWVTYQPNLPQDQVDKLRQEVDGPYLILSPYPGLPTPVVASAWGKQLQLTGADDPRLQAFITKYRQGPQTPEPGAACTGGTDGTGQGGTPMGQGQ